MQTIYRVRVKKNRWGFENLENFLAFHTGKRSLYIGKITAKRDFWGIKHISDIRGKTTIKKFYIV